MQALGLLPVVQEQAVFSDARNAEVGANAADGQHQGVVTKGTFWRNRFPRIVRNGVKCDFLFFSINPREASEPEFIVVPYRVRQETDFIVSYAAGTRREFMQ